MVFVKVKQKDQVQAYSACYSAYLGSAGKQHITHPNLFISTLCQPSEPLKSIVTLFTTIKISRLKSACVYLDNFIIRSYDHTIYK